MITALDIRNKTVVEDLFDLLSITALNDGRSLELDFECLHHEALRAKAVRGGPISAWEIRNRHLLGNSRAEHFVNRAARGREIHLRGEAVAAQVLRLDYLRDEGQARVRYARARWTF